MIRSMTAFARAAAPTREGAWHAEIRSLNSRYFEFQLKTPPILNTLENRIREMVQAKMRRGKVSLAIGQDTDDTKVGGLKIDESKVAFYIKQLSKVQKKYKLQGTLAVADLLKLPGIFSAEESDQDAEKVWPQIKKILQQVLDLAVKSKHGEGAKLSKDISHRLDLIEKAVEIVEKNALSQPERFHKRLLERVQGLISDQTIDKERLEREVAFLAERSDITEELVRLRSHFELFRKRLTQETEVGRELDFLCQEMNREINTMGSKSQHFEISTQVVFVKGELEKIREQVQNIE